ncbi:MAG: hypothetical protein ACRD7E_24570 [Bryobacteraceae bacterium]
MGTSRVLATFFLLALAPALLQSQIIEFESGGLKYQTLTRNGLTIMLARLPSHVREYSVLQVAVSNGSGASQTIRPEDFIYRKLDGISVSAAPARRVVDSLVEKAGRGDVVKLVTAYESGIYGNDRYRATNGYEERRRSFLAEVSSTRIKAAAAASAIALVQTKLAPGESTDGAVFYVSAGRPMGPGTVTVRAAGAVFEFPMLLSE